MSTIRNIVLVTGGNNGIGLATCQLFAAQPNYHCIMASRSLEKGYKALESISSKAAPDSISLLQLDVASDDSIMAAVEEVKAKHGRLDILINNAGICPTDFSRHALRDCLETNSISPAMVTKAFAPLLLQSIGPRVIYVSSALGSIGKRSDRSDSAYDADYKVYRMSKAALNMLMVCDSWEYKGAIKVFSYCPGFVITDLAGMREEKTRGGIAKSPETSANGLFVIAQGLRDAESGLFLHEESVGSIHPW